MEISYSSLSEIGKSRKINQDALFAYTGNGFGLFIVADGMGGLSEGERASREIVDSYQAWIERYEKEAEDMDPGTILAELRTVLSQANDRINNETKSGQTCGSTAVVLFLRKDFYAIISVGDSRIYEIEKRVFYTKLRQLTIDDVWKYEGDNTGKLTNAVGINSRLKCHAQSDTLKKNNLFLLCSDGIYRYCQEKDMVNSVIKYMPKDLESAVNEIKRIVYQNGAGDNLSLILVYCTI